MEVRNNNRSGKYTYGNVARNLDVVREIEKEPRIHIAPRHNEDGKRQGLGLFYITYLTAMLGIVVVALVSFIRLNCEITTLADRVSLYEQTLNKLTLENDDEYSKMINAIDYDEIRNVAINELGMVYASADQIVNYTRENSDYVIQFADISD